MTIVSIPSVLETTGELVPNDRPRKCASNYT